MLKAAEHKAGVVLDDTSQVAQSAHISAQWVRWVRAKWQTMGGFEARSTDKFPAKVRGAHEWRDLNGNQIVAAGNATTLSVEYGGEILDITPLKGEGTLENPFSVTNGSATVDVEHLQHGFKTGDAVTFANSVAVGGLTLNGAQTITVLNDNKYRFTAGSNASSTATGGGYVDFTCPLDAGLVDGSGGSGYGTGGYGSGAYGEPTTGETYARTWALDNWGQNLLANPRGGALFEWQPAASYPEIIENGDFAASAGWTAGTDWTIATGVATKTAGTASNLAQAIDDDAEGGKTYRVQFTVTRAAGTLKLGINAGLASPAIVDVGFPVNASGTYSRLITLPAEPLDLVFQADSSFAGTVDNVSFKLESKAYRIETAPAKMNSMFVAPQRVVVALGTYNEDGEYDRTLVRWSGVENNRTWIPATDNVCGSLTASVGSEVLKGVASRSQNVVWTDAAALALAATGGSVFYELVLLGTGCGIIGPLAACESSGFVFWISRAGDAYMFQGTLSSADSSPLQKIDNACVQDFFKNRASGQDDKIITWVNDRYSEFWFMYADKRDGIEISRYQAFRWVEPCWTTGSLARTSVIGGGSREFPIAFGDDGTVYLHEKGDSANGDVLNWHVQTGYTYIDGAKNLVRVRGLMPDLNEVTGAVTLQCYGKNFSQDEGALLATRTVTGTTRQTHLKFSRRLMSIRWSGSAASTFAREGVTRIDIEPSGMRQ